MQFHCFGHLCIWFSPWTRIWVVKEIKFWTRSNHWKNMKVMVNIKISSFLYSLSKAKVLCKITYVVYLNSIIYRVLHNMVTFNSWQIWNNYLDSKAWFYWIYQKIAVYGPTLSEAVSVHCTVKFNELVYLIGAIDCPKLFETLSQICAGKFHETWIYWSLNLIFRIVESIKISSLN